MQRNLILQKTQTKPLNLTLLYGDIYQYNNDDEMLELYHSTQQTRAAWVAIATNLNQEIDFLKKKWRNLYDSFRKCEHRKKELTPSGAAASREPSCKFFKQLLFLKDVVSGKMTYTNVPTPRNDVDFSEPSDSQPATRKQKKRKVDVQIDDLEISIVSGLQERATAEHIKDEDELFCSSPIKEAYTKRKLSSENENSAGSV